MSDVDAAGAILNTRRNLALAGGGTLSVRRLKTREVIEWVDRVGAEIVRALSNRDGQAVEWTQQGPRLISAMGGLSVIMFASLCERLTTAGGVQLSGEDVNDLDVQDYANLVLLFTEMHEQAIKTFRAAFSKFEVPKRTAAARPPASPSPAPSTGSSAADTP